MTSPRIATDRQGSKVSRSGRRKDMTSLIMAERSKRFLNDEEMKKFEEAFYNARMGPPMIPLLGGLETFV